MFALIEQPRLGLVEPSGDRAADRGRGAAGRVPGLRVARAGTRCCRWGCSGGATSRRGTSRRSRCTRAWRSCSSSSILFLQQIGGYSPLKSGLATLPVTVVMFVLSRRFGALADRYGPRFFMGAGPLDRGGAGCCCSSAWACRSTTSPKCCPPLLVFSLGLSMTVAPLTAAVLAGSEHQAGIASGVNNAIARVAGLLGTAAVGRGDRLGVRRLGGWSPAERLPRRRRAGGGAPKPSGCRSGYRTSTACRGAQAHAVSLAARAGLACTASIWAW